MDIFDNRPQDMEARGELIMMRSPFSAETLYREPWAILPGAHRELCRCYHTRAAAPAPVALGGSAQLTEGIGFSVDAASGIVVVSVEGVIVKRMGSGFFGPRMADLAVLDLILRDIGNDDSLRTVVMFFNTPGGLTIGLPETSANIRDLIAGGKRVVAFVDVLCASAGFFLAAACEEIIAAPSARLGGIGAFIALVDSSREFEMEGLELKLFRSGDLKGIGLPGKPMTEVEAAHLQAGVDENFSLFQSHLAATRPAIAADSMRGQVFTAASAPAGIVDATARDLDELLAVEMILEA